MGPEDINIKKYEELPSPREIKERIYNGVGDKVTRYRKSIENILEGVDDRKLIITGPCSVHNVEEALTYAKRLKDLQEEVEDKQLLVMRTYFEKPRTSIGWKGLISDPYLDGSNNIGEGLEKARKFLIDVSRIGVPTGTEFLGPLTPQYISDLVSWSAIGARTTESQPHREIASGLSMPVGFKNSTSGQIVDAINSIKSARSPHSFLGVNQEGNVGVVNTSGNNYSHLILRGGKQNGNYLENYDENTIDWTLTKLEEEELPGNIVVDCSHGNSGKDYKKQPEVFRRVMEFMKDCRVKGVMLESYLKDGNQSLDEMAREGVSVTDGCMGWETTRSLILESYKRL